MGVFSCITWKQDSKSPYEAEARAEPAKQAPWFCPYCAVCPCLASQTRNILCGIITLISLFLIGILLFVIGGVYELKDMYILGATLLVGCFISTVVFVKYQFIPYRKHRQQVGSEESAVDLHQVVEEEKPHKRETARNIETAAMVAHFSKLTKTAFVRRSVDSSGSPRKPFPSPSVIQETEEPPGGLVTHHVVQGPTAPTSREGAVSPKLPDLPETPISAPGELQDTQTGREQCYGSDYSTCISEKDSPEPAQPSSPEDVIDRNSYPQVVHDTPTTPQDTLYPAPPAENTDDKYLPGTEPERGGFQDDTVLESSASYQKPVTADAYSMQPVPFVEEKKVLDNVEDGDYSIKFPKTELHEEPSKKKKKKKKKKSREEDVFLPEPANFNDDGQEAPLAGTLDGSNTNGKKKKKKKKRKRKGERVGYPAEASSSDGNKDVLDSRPKFRSKHSRNKDRTSSEEKGSRDSGFVNISMYDGTENATERQLSNSENPGIVGFRESEL